MHIPSLYRYSNLQRRFNFTRAAIKSLPIPEKDRAYYYDVQCPYLELRITNKGKKTFCFYKWVKSTQRAERITISKFEDVSIEVARERAHKLNGQVAEGESPVHSRKASKSEITFKELFELYMNRHAKPYKKSWKEDEDKGKNWISKERFYSLRLSQIVKSDISALHAKIGKDHPINANRVLALISSVYGRAIEWDIATINPCLGIRRFKEKSRDRFLQKEELPKFFEALEQLPNTTMRDYFKVLLFTGARRSNVLSMRWKDINFDQAEWFIEETKNGTSQRVPLSEVVLEILKQRFSERSSNWVFPSTVKAVGHIKEPRKAWESILKTMGIDDLRIHDLRRTLGSWQAITGASLTVIGKSLNHKSVHTTQIYARMSLDPVRESMKKAQDEIIKHSKK